MKKSKTREWAEALLVAVLVALFVRSFFIQAFKIPSGSMEPTLLIGDYLIVNRLSYVVKMPFTDSVLLTLGNPKRGDVIVFRYPKDRSKDFIKRVVATEGETVEVRDKALYINGNKIEDPWGHYRAEGGMLGFPMLRESLQPVKVPKDSYFVLGDNRDNSQDSRYWGFVHKDDLVGRAFILYFSWNSNAESPIDQIRWSRIGNLIK